MSMTEEQIETARRERRKITYTSPYSGKRVLGSVVKTVCDWPRGDDQVCAEIHDGRILEPGGYYDVPWSDLELAPPEMEKFRVQFDIDLNTDDLKNLDGVEIPRRPILGYDFEKFVRDRMYSFIETLHEEWQETADMSNMRVCPVHRVDR